MNYDCIVIGGGIVGTAAAYELARAGVNTLLVDRHDVGRATDAGAGILSFATLALGDDGLLYDFAMACGSYYTRLIEQLRSEQEGDPGYAQCGELIVAVDDDEVGDYEHLRHLILDQQKRRGQPPSGALEDLTATQARELFPPLGNVLRALYYRDAARIDGRLVTAAMCRAAEAQGLTIREGSVERLVIERGAVTGVVVKGEPIHADRLIIAGGAWSTAFENQLGLRLALNPSRGQIIHFSLPDIDTSRWPILNAFHGHYIVCWDDSRVAAGATFEPDSGFHPHTTAAGVRQVLSEALRTAPGLANAQIKEIRVGLRPVSADGLPTIDPVPGLENIFLATGHGAVGLQMGPFSGKLASDWAAGKTLESDLRPFAADRHNH